MVEEEITKKEDEPCGFAPYLTRSRPSWGLSLPRGKKQQCSSHPSQRASLLSPTPLASPPWQCSRRPQRRTHPSRRAGPVWEDLTAE